MFAVVLIPSEGKNRSSLFALYRSERVANRLALDISETGEYVAVFPVSADTLWLLPHEQKLVSQGWTGKFTYAHPCYDPE